ncbi:ABC transporter ATP-binding protein [Xanthovirga aplysinae]|uniref:ABC transporter ATP-binding protein n=1 Tax=Xanthovirga aplysinae TaxID=2529853 RepID=UPI0012BBF69A|nr:ABC transporter ATP-binding protein [Xanthovirga aplysinae]MTI32251.1 ABC transporter ATP-binding protein [Xanthovirga aplysinae]
MSFNYPILQTKKLTVGYKKGKNQLIPVLKDVDLELFRGELVCFLGPNGVGKSTLLRTISSVQPTLRGEVQLDGKPLKKYRVQEIAKKISLVLTEKVSVNHLNVFELVSLGRYAHTSWSGKLVSKDREIVQHALEVTHTNGLVEKQVQELSDGQLQKVMIARALAQDGELIILDEPTAHLDLTNRMEIMLLLKKLAHEQQKAILVSTHELELAIHTADRLWLASPGQPIYCGLPEDLILEGKVAQTFLKEGISFDQSSGKFKVLPVKGLPIKVEGSGLNYLWTRHALERKGYLPVTTNSNYKLQVFENPRRWLLKTEEQENIYSSLRKLLFDLERVSQQN